MDRRPDVTEDVSWDSVETLSIGDFHERWTLHDAGLRGMRIDPVGPLVVVVDVDRHWNAAIPEGFSTLLIRFEHPYLVHWTRGGWWQPTLEGATSSLVDPRDREALIGSPDFEAGGYQSRPDPSGWTHPSEDEELTRTRFEFMNWSACEVLHGRPVQCVVVNGAGEVVDLASLR